MNDMLIGSHVSISGGLLGAATEAHSYGANVFMVYTGAPQNTVRKDISGMKVAEGKAFMAEHGIEGFVVHAPYIVNPASPDPQKFDFAVSFLRREMARTAALGADKLVLHPGGFMDSTLDDGISRIVQCIDKLTEDDDSGVTICLETMAGKGTEIGRSFGELARIIGGVAQPNRVGVCFDTCHVHDAGYDIIDNLDEVMTEFDKTIGLDNLKLFHINGSLNKRGARKDRHANIGAGFDNAKGADNIGFDAIRALAWSRYAAGRYLILETPWISDTENLYRQEIAALRRPL